MRTDEHRPRQEQKAVDSHPVRKRVAFFFRAGGGQAKENWRVADRIYNRKQSGIDQQEGVEKIRHGAGSTTNGVILKRNCSVVVGLFLISLCLKHAQFTAKLLRYNDKREALNWRVALIAQQNMHFCLLASHATVIAKGRV